MIALIAKNIDYYSFLGKFAASKKLTILSYSELKTSIHFILAESGNTFSGQLNNCFKQLNNIREELNKPSKIISLTFFVAAESSEKYQSYKEIANSYVKERFAKAHPAVAFVSQDPENGKSVALEVFMDHGMPNRLIYKQHENIPYVVVEHKNYKEVYVSGLTGAIKGDIHENSNTALSQMEKILNAEKMDFSNIVRQWNYIERITHVSDKLKKFQHYQIFNDIRSDFYSKSEFINGYPSATGIGASACGVVVNFIAVSNSANVKITPVKNPEQIDAHQYSQKVLVGRESYKSSPKFERGKLVTNGEGAKMYISGTAAIVGESTLFPDDVEKQVIVTINNIKNLVKSAQIPKLYDTQPDEESSYSYVRAYVKYAKDIETVKRLCEKHFNSDCFQCLVSDICRDNLLVEIEGLIEY